MKSIEYLEEQKFGYDHFTKLTNTGIEPDYDNIAQFAEDYHKAKLNLLNIPDVIVPFYCGEQEEGRQICDSQCMGCDGLERKGK